MAQRQRLIVGNWKMHKTIPEARGFVERLAELLHGQAKVGPGGASAGAPPDRMVTIIIAPPFTALAAVAAAIKSLPLDLAAQDAHWEDLGAFTGEVSVPMLKNAGCRYVIVGHSERRRYFGETDATVKKKVAAVLHHGLRPILCIGETGEQRSNGQTEQVLLGQLTEALSGVEKDRAADIVVAYEPIWAIGSGRPATAEQARDAHRHIRTTATALWGQETGGRLSILYGGSVTPDNIGEFLALGEVDGALVGGACLDPVQFAKILAIAQTHS